MPSVKHLVTLIDEEGTESLTQEAFMVMVDAAVNARPTSPVPPLDLPVMVEGE